MTTKRVYSVDGGYRTIQVIEEKQQKKKQEYPKLPFECSCGYILYTIKELEEHFHYSERKEYYVE